MAHLLRIDSSTRLTGSYSSDLATYAETIWKNSNPSGTITRRHLAENPLPVLKQDTITGFYTAPDEMSDALKDATALSDKLIAEVQEADMLLLAVPMYNFSVPAALKLWIDHVVRVNRTFSMEDGAFKGLLPTRRALAICAYGAEGYLPGQPFEAANFLEPYLQFLLSFLGIDDVQTISVQATTADEKTVAANRATAEAKIKAALS